MFFVCHFSASSYQLHFLSSCLIFSTAPSPPSSSSLRSLSVHYLSRPHSICQSAEESLTSIRILPYPLLLLRKEWVFPAFSILLRKEWKSSIASVCSVEPFFVCHPLSLLRKESAFPAFPILLRKEWKSCVASVCSVEPFFLCHPRLLLRKEWTKWGYVGRCSTISEGV